MAGGGGDGGDGARCRLSLTLTLLLLMMMRLPQTVAKLPGGERFVRDCFFCCVVPCPRPRPRSRARNVHDEHLILQRWGNDGIYF